MFRQLFKKRVFECHVGPWSPDEYVKRTSMGGKVHSPCPRWLGGASSQCEAERLCQGTMPPQSRIWSSCGAHERSHHLGPDTKPPATQEQACVLSGGEQDPQIQLPESPSIMRNPTRLARSTMHLTTWAELANAPDATSSDVRFAWRETPLPEHSLRRPLNVGIPFASSHVRLAHMHAQSEINTKVSTKFAETSGRGRCTKEGNKAKTLQNTQW